MSATRIGRDIDEMAVEEAGNDWPPQVDLVMSALESGQHGVRENRAHPRASYRAIAALRLFSDAPDAKPWRIYTRDASVRGIGFITQHCLPLGYGGILEIALPGGDVVQIPCTLNRCRQAAPGWFEGSLQFNRERREFSPEHSGEPTAGLKICGV